MKTIKKLLVNKMKVICFPIHEYWSDIGTPDDLEKAREYISKGINQ